MDLSIIPCKISLSFSKMQDFPEKKYSLPLKGMYVSVIFSMNLTYGILVLHVISNTTMKDPLLAKKHLSFFCNFPLRNLFFSIRNTPTNYGGILEKMHHSF